MACAWEIPPEGRGDPVASGGAVTDGLGPPPISADSPNTTAAATRNEDQRGLRQAAAASRSDGPAFELAQARPQRGRSRREIRGSDAVPQSSFEVVVHDRTSLRARPSRMWPSARLRRDLTVPIGQSRRSAVAASVRSNQKWRTTTTRSSGARRLTASVSASRSASSWNGSPGPGPIVVGGEGDESDPRSASKTIAADVHEDPVEPGLEGCLVAERVCRLPAAFERIADGILCLGATPEDQARRACRVDRALRPRAPGIDDVPQMALAVE